MIGIGPFTVPFFFGKTLIVFDEEKRRREQRRLAQPFKMVDGLFGCSMVVV